MRLEKYLYHSIAEGTDFGLYHAAKKVLDGKNEKINKLVRD
jgi:hypothetical protein